MPKFSIITPTFNRADGRLQRCLASVRAQTFEDWEHIVVDDGSTDDTAEVVEGVEDPRVRYVYVEHGGRVVARNTGMRKARGEWFCWLDSDDAYDPMYLATVEHHARSEPEARLWVCGAVYHGMIKDEKGRHICPRWTKMRKAWMPPVDTDGTHSEHFPSGKVGTGMFVYHRECYEKIGSLPDWRNHLEIADGIDEWLGYTTGYSAKERWVGNPFGDDFAMLRALTLHYRVHLIEAALYVQYVR